MHGPEFGLNGGSFPSQNSGNDWLVLQTLMAFVLHPGRISDIEVFLPHNNSQDMRRLRGSENAQRDPRRTNEAHNADLHVVMVTITQIPS